MENKPVIRRKKVCPRCGRKLWLREFTKLKSGSRHSWCRECVIQYKRDAYNRKRKVPDGTFYSKRWGRVVTHSKYSTRFHWNENEITLLKKYFPNTSNAEVAEMLGVSLKTIDRKAHSLGLKKDKEYLLCVARENILLANSVNPRLHAK